MQFAMLIYQGTMPLPNTEAWQSLPAEDRKAIYTGYAAINKNPAVTPGVGLGPAASAKTVRVQNGSRARPRVPSPGWTVPSAATSCSRPRMRPRPSSWRQAFPRHDLAARSKCAPSSRTSSSDTTHHSSTQPRGATHADQETTDDEPSLTSAPYLVNDRPPRAPPPACASRMPRRARARRSPPDPPE